MENNGNPSSFHGLECLALKAKALGFQNGHIYIVELCALGVVELWKFVQCYMMMYGGCVVPVVIQYLLFSE